MGDNKLGPTGSGELKAGLFREGDHLRMAFGTAVTWVDMTPAEARHWAAGLLLIAGQIDGEICTVQREGRTDGK